MKTITLLLVLVFGSKAVQASHIAGGYIQTKAITNQALTYEVDVILYLHESSGSGAADAMNSLTLCYGDGQTSTVTRATRAFVLNREFSLNTYRINHTYAGPGTYTLTMSLSGRTMALNILKADSQLFTLATTFTTNTVTPNQSPTPGFPSTGFRIGANQEVRLSLKATDADGDSLVYGLAKPLTSPTLTNCTRQPVSSYQFPNDLTHQGTFKLDKRTGELVWNAPVQQGNYSISIDLFEYRNGILISQTTQEILLTVEDLPTTPGIIPPYEPAMEGAIITATVPYADADIILTVFPNPVDDRLQVLIQTSNPTVATIQLVDINGRKLHELAFKRSARKHEQVIDMGSLTPGVYLIRADVGGRSLQQKIVKR